MTTFVVYQQVRHFDFLNFDDPDYVIENSHVRAGLTWAGAAWAMTTYHAANWFPMTWLSHMLDVQLSGLRSGWHHIGNVLIHILSSLVLFAALKRMTRDRWPSFFVALVFALHPLHAESVAWVAERKDVLCALFWFLALWCYARYAERLSVGRYSLVLAAFCLGLMSKPMIVTLPFVLILVDGWPLQRLSRFTLLKEKLPFFALTIASSVITFVAQSEGGAVRSLETIPLGARIGNALLSYVTYLARTFWPARLAVFYPYSQDLAVWRVALSALLLGIISYAAVRRRADQPYLLVGWLWFLGTLIPVIGIVQVGGQSSADRYTYVPMVGLLIAISWAGRDVVRKWPTARMPVFASAAVASLACAVLTWRQAGYWANSEALFQHAIAVTSGNHIAHNNLASYYLRQRRDADATGHIYEALRIKPTYPEAHVNLGTFLRRSGRNAEAEREYRIAIGLQPANVDAHAGFGALLIAEGRTAEALGEFQKAVALNPDYADGHYDLGRVLAAMGRGREAMEEFAEAVRLRPDHAEAHRSLAMGLISQGRLTDALTEFAALVRITPSDARLRYDFATLLESAGRNDDAIQQFSEAVRIRPDFTEARRRLDAAVARRGYGGPSTPGR